MRSKPDDVSGLLEPCAGKLARTVLRGRGGGNATPLPDNAKGASVRKGEKASPIVFYREVDKTGDTSNTDDVRSIECLDRPNLRGYKRVLNGQVK